MFTFKLQLGCIIVLAYIIALYIRGTRSTHIIRNHYFDLLLWITPLAVTFDGVTAWTVNHMDIVPGWLNLLFHALFYITMDIVIILSYIYMIEITQGIPKDKKGRILILLIPAFISISIILGFLWQTYYIAGETTYYSMGISAIACYASMVVHFGLIFGNVLIKRRTLEKRKFIGIISFLSLSFLMLLVQIIWPESLVSAILPTLLVLGLYINFEDPNIKRVQLFYSEMVISFSTLVESRDNSTGGHIKRTKGYVGIILDEMQKHTKYRKILTRDYTKNILEAAPLHDIGKISTPDYILQKPGKLTDDEYTIMKQHSSNGGEIIRNTFNDLSEPEFIQIAYEVAKYHHEKWNGKGYPEGLKGEEIPLHARVMAIADVFDAVSAKRCYRDALPLDVCFDIIEKGSGTDFDPELTKIFMDAKDEVLNLYNGQT